MAHQIAQNRLLLALIAICAVRLIAGAVLPLSADEAYYWLWTRHLAAGYYDHPPLIAWLIAAGTAIFGQSGFGVRIAGIVLSFAATWMVWDSAKTLLGDKRSALLAALFFNLTLMTTVETLAATPDAPQVFTAAAFLWALAKVLQTGKGAWWIAVGAAAGLGLLSKYSTLFLGAGALVWLVGCPSMRRWLLTPWPYLGGAVALLFFLPNVLWNADHGWMTFAFQFGRIAGHQITLKYLGEFIGAQLLLASPFILILGVMGLVTTRWSDPRRALIASLLWPSIVYFLIHTLHDRVQGNWPCYLYPALAIAAVAALQKTDWTGWRVGLAKWSGKLAVPVASVLLVVALAQALIGIVPMGRKDPLARLLAVGMPDVVAALDAVKAKTGADIVLTTDYASTGWFAFYSPYRIASLGEDYRWPNSAHATPADYAKPALYIAETRRDLKPVVARAFSSVTEVARIDRTRKGVPIAHYVVYRVAGPKTAALGRLP